MAIGAYLSGYPAIHYSNQMNDPSAVLLFFVSLGLCVGIGGAILLMVFLLARWSGRIHSALPGVVMVLIFAWMIADISTASGSEKVPPYLVFSKLIELLSNLYAAMLSGGLEMAGKVSSVLPAMMRAPVCFIVLLIGGGCCAAAAGLVVGLPTLRLRGDYLAIATLGFAEIIRVVITTSKPLGGALGMDRIPIQTNFGWLYGAAIVTVVVIWRLAYSAKGRAIMAVRDDEIAAAAVGIDTTHHKVIAFVIGAFFAGVGGALYAHYTGFITPTDFSIVRSIEFVVMVTLGGLASISGAIMAAIVLTLLPELLRVIADWRMVIYSLLLVVMMLLRPQGLLGGRELWFRRSLPKEQPA
jgi:ABC-type branched-subunit amino acid transport system permease subunit